LDPRLLNTVKFCLDEEVDLKDGDVLPENQCARPMNGPFHAGDPDFKFVKMKDRQHELFK
jgi:hypothetical protein